MSRMLPVHIVANAALGPLLSGGDNIFIECARRWARRGHPVTVYVWEEGQDMCRRCGLDNVDLVVWSARSFKKFGFFVHYVARILIGSFRAIKVGIPGPFVVYSASDFWPDLLPAFLIKRRHPRAVWAAGFYLFAPSPGSRASVYRGADFFRGLAYWLTQRPAYALVRRYADKVLVTSEPDVPRFITSRRTVSDVLAVRGGVDTQPSREYLARAGAETDTKMYDACFIGRFHPQKGTLELIEIWKKVVLKRPGARLAMIGDGPLGRELADRVSRYGLDKNVSMLGFLEGEAKYGVFRQSRIVVHPAIYDSGGMAAAEAMAWGLPGVGFDLEALRTYYPAGMLKAPCRDLDAFAGLVLTLLSDRALYETLRRQALDLIASQWDWERQVDSVSGVLFETKGLSS